MGSDVSIEHPMMQDTPKWLGHRTKCLTARQRHLRLQVVEREPWDEAYVLEPPDDDPRAMLMASAKPATEASFHACDTDEVSICTPRSVLDLGSSICPRAASLKIGNGLAYSVVADAACASTSRARNRR